MTFDLVAIKRGIHDINRPFAFASNPQFIFHDSPGFEAGDETQLKAVQKFIEERARSTEVNNQLHAIWSLSLSLSLCFSHLLASTGSVLYQIYQDSYWI